MEYEIILIVVIGIKINFGADFIFDNSGKQKAIAIEFIGKYNTFQKNGCVSINTCFVEIIKFNPRKIIAPIVNPEWECADYMRDYSEDLIPLREGR